MKFLNDKRHVIDSGVLVIRKSPAKNVPAGVNMNYILFIRMESRHLRIYCTYIHLFLADCALQLLFLLLFDNQLPDRYPSDPARGQIGKYKEAEANGDHGDHQRHRVVFQYDPAQTDQTEQHPQHLR